MLTLGKKLKSHRNSNKLLVIHPWGFAALPPLVVIRRYFFDTSIEDLVIVFFSGYAVAILFWFMARLFVKDVGRRAVIISIWLMLFFSFGIVHDGIRGVSFLSKGVARFRYILPGFLLLCALIGTIVARIRSQLINLTKVLNVVAVSLIVLTVVGTIWNAGHIYYTNNADKELPDIYYIVPDMYGNARTLSDVYEFDNGEFINFLEQQGFYVASESVSNYPNTFNSLASSLNMEYINYLSDLKGEQSVDLTATARMVQTSHVMRVLKTKGFMIINFDSGLPITAENKLADFTIYPNWAYPAVTSLVQMTPLGPLRERIYQRDDRADRLLFIFNELGQVKAKHPFFLFAHLLCPHSPFIFGPNGERRDPSKIPLDGGKGLEYRQGYTDQVSFVNKQMKTAIEQILVRPGKKPVIIIQGDHGPASHPEWQNPSQGFLRERFGILNAYYVPPEIRARLYPYITPVNTFRLLLDRYADGNYPLLPDRSYFNTYERPYSFRDITEELRGNSR